LPVKILSIVFRDTICEEFTGKKNPCCTDKQELAAETQEGGPKSGLLRPHQRRLYLRAAAVAVAAVQQRRMMSNFDESTNFGLDQDKESIYTRRPS
jgi:hypothetical protein